MALYSVIPPDYSVQGNPICGLGLSLGSPPIFDRERSFCLLSRRYKILPLHPLEAEYSLARFVRAFLFPHPLIHRYIRESICLYLILSVDMRIADFSSPLPYSFSDFEKEFFELAIFDLIVS